MARVPTAIEGGLGKVRTAAPATPKFSGMSSPDFRNTGAISISRGLQSMTAELERAQKEAQANTNKAALLAAQRTLRGWSLQSQASYTDVKSGAFGHNADKDWVNKQAEAYNDLTRTLFERKEFQGLDESGQQALQATVQELGFRHYAGVLNHHNKQMEEAVNQERAANIAVMRDEVIANPSAFDENMSVITGYVADLLHSQGVEDETVVWHAIQGELSTVVKTTVENLVNNERMGEAKAFLAAHTQYKVRGLKEPVDLNADVKQDLVALIIRGDEHMAAKGAAQAARAHAATQRYRQNLWHNALVSVGKAEEVPLSVKNQLPANQRQLLDTLYAEAKIRQVFPERPTDPASYVRLGSMGTQEAGDMTLEEAAAFKATLSTLDAKVFDALRRGGVNQNDAGARQLAIAMSTAASKQEKETDDAVIAFAKQSLATRGYETSSPEYAAGIAATTALMRDAKSKGLSVDYEVLTANISRAGMSADEMHNQRDDFDETMLAVIASQAGMPVELSSEAKAVSEVAKKYRLSPMQITHLIPLYQSYYGQTTGKVKGDKLDALLSKLDTTPVPVELALETRIALVKARQARGDMTYRPTDKDILRSLKRGLLSDSTTHYILHKWLGKPKK